MTIVHSRTDKYPGIIYRLSMETLTYLILIQPNTGPYLKSVVLILLPVLIGMMVINMDKKVQNSPGSEKSGKKTYFILVALPLVI